jgi:hypothetical protein
MKIRLEIPKIPQLPSQGRNPGSIPGGSTIFDEEWKILNIFMGQAQVTLVPMTCYRAWVGSEAQNPEFVFFVGRTSACDALVFEDAAGDLHKFHFDEIDISAGK